MDDGRTTTGAETRDGIDLLGLLAGTAQPRAFLTSMYGEPGTSLFKVMIRQGDWKYIFLANGGREQLFNVVEDPAETRNLAAERTEMARRLRALAAGVCNTPGAAVALAGDDLRIFPFRPRPLHRIYQFDRSRGVTGFPARPEDVLKG
jgi:choline-sulfatase